MSELSAADFKWDGYVWTTTIELPVWTAFQDRSGAYGAKADGHGARGGVRVVFGPEGRDDSALEDREVEHVHVLEKDTWPLCGRVRGPKTARNVARCANASVSTETLRPEFHDEAV